MGNLGDAQSHSKSTTARVHTMSIFSKPSREHKDRAPRENNARPLIANSISFETFIKKTHYYTVKDAFVSMSLNDFQRKMCICEAV